MRTNPAIDRLTVKLKNLRIEYEKYFSGALDMPPGELQFEIQKELRDLREAARGSIDSFRLSTLEAQFRTYTELYNRRMRDREEGRQPRRQVVKSQPQFDPQEGVVISERPQEGAVEALYQGLYAGPSSTQRVDLESFRSYLNRQTSAIRQKTGCSQVKFRLSNEGGKLKLKAKPIKS